MSFAAQTRDPYNYGWRPPTTMVDVMFLILAFFIMVAAFRDEERQIDINLPAAETGKQAASATMQVLVTVTGDGAVYMGDQPFTLDGLRATLTKVGQQFPDASLVVRGDRDSHLGTTVQVMDIARSAGLQNVYLGTTRQSQGP